jgi:hypothetical protein
MASTMDRPRPCPSWWWARRASRRWIGRKSRSSSPGGTTWPVLVTVSAVGGVGGDVNVPAGNVVADCVVDEVNGETLEESGVADQGRDGWRC